MRTKRKREVSKPPQNTQINNSSTDTLNSFEVIYYMVACSLSAFCKIPSMASPTRRGKNLAEQETQFYAVRWAENLFLIFSPRYTFFRDVRQSRYESSRVEVTLASSRCSHRDGVGSATTGHVTMRVFSLLPLADEKCGQ